MNEVRIKKVKVEEREKMEKWRNTRHDDEKRNREKNDGRRSDFRVDRGKG